MSDEIDWEALAAIEHEQWAHWTRYMLANLTPENIERWSRQTDTPYAALTENEKDSDRDWARKAVKAALGDEPAYREPDDCPHRELSGSICVECGAGLRWVRQIWPEVTG